VWRRYIGGLGVLVACATASSERRHLPDGSWQLSCKLPMEECVRQIEAICPDRRFRIVSGQSTIKLVDVAPGTREYPRSELVVRCGQAPEQEVPADRNVAGSVPPASAKASCVPGATQSCVGAGACSGGQACRPDGLGFGRCDCGSVSKVPSADGGIADAPTSS